MDRGGRAAAPESGHCAASGARSCVATWLAAGRQLHLPACTRHTCGRRPYAACCSGDFTSPCGGPARSRRHVWSGGLSLVPGHCGCHIEFRTSDKGFCGLRAALNFRLSTVDFQLSTFNCPSHQLAYGVRSGECALARGRVPGRRLIQEGAPWASRASGSL
jgi:hypothetical protein